MLDAQKFIWMPKILVTAKDDNVTEFKLNYLPRWLGNTLGNAIRRTVLSYSLWGAVTGLKIKWVPHEYHAIDWVKENVINIMLAFKKLRFKLDENVESIQWVENKFKWVWKYTSNDLKLPAWVELVSTDAELFEITDPSTELVMDIRIEKGYKYYSVDFLRERDTDVNMLIIDNDFTLVDYITYEVDSIIDDFTGSTKESLRIDLRTLFSNVSAKEIMMFAGEVLASYAKLFAFDNVFIDTSVFTDASELQTESVSQTTTDAMPLKTMPIDALPLSERTRNALIKNEILYVEDLEKRKKNELLTMKWVGKKAIDEINSALENIGKDLLR